MSTCSCWQCDPQSHFEGHITRVTISAGSPIPPAGNGPARSPQSRLAGPTRLLATLTGTVIGAGIALTVILLGDALLIVGSWIWDLFGDRWLIVAAAAGAVWGGVGGWTEPGLLVRRRRG